VPGRNVVPVDRSVPFEIASLVGCAVMTGVGMAITTAAVEPGQTVVVIGGGGIGSAAVQGARLPGATVILAVDPAAGKHEQLVSFGATHTATPDELEQAVRELTGGHGFDHALEAVGRPETIRAAWDATRRGGKTVLAGIGSPTTTIPFNAYELVLDATQLIGSVGGSVHSARDFPRYLDLWRAGKLDLEGLITERIDLSGAPGAMEALNSGADISRQVIVLD
jgi:S-(hydroxymethyl)glutathione dehydrogenase/alcohol dehydrogenase